MRGFLKFWLFPFLCFVFAFAVSYVAFHSRWFAVEIFHSVPMMRLCESAGSVALLPVRIVFFCFGGLFDQSTPDSDPLNYLMVNAVLLGLLFYACLRPVVYRGKKPAK